MLRCGGQSPAWADWACFFSSRRRHTRLQGDWSSDVCSSDLSRPAASIGAVIVVFFAAIALLAPWIAPYGIHQQVGSVYGHPTAHHPLGLDDGGIDMLSLLIWGARISMLVGFAATLVFIGIGGGIG